MFLFLIFAPFCPLPLTYPASYAVITRNAKQDYLLGAGTRLS